MLTLEELLYFCDTQICKDLKKLQILFESLHADVVLGHRLSIGLVLKEGIKP